MNASVTRCNGRHPTDRFENFASPVTQAKAFDMPDPWDQYRLNRVRAYAPMALHIGPSPDRPGRRTQNSSVVPSNSGDQHTTSSQSSGMRPMHHGYQVNVNPPGYSAHYTQRQHNVTVNGLA